MTGLDALPLRILDADPQGEAAMELLRLAALEVRAMYARAGAAPAPAPRNEPLWPRGAYLIAWLDGEAVGMAAHRPLDARCTEMRRVFVRPAARRHGIARRLIEAVEAHAAARGFTQILLETGCRQLPAIALYEACGYHRIEPFGDYIDDPSSVCLAKAI